MRYTVVQHRDLDTEHVVLVADVACDSAALKARKNGQQLGWRIFQTRARGFFSPARKRDSSQKRTSRSNLSSLLKRRRKESSQKLACGASAQREVDIVESTILPAPAF